jgi:Protein of unknown function (DUF3106)
MSALPAFAFVRRNARRIGALLLTLAVGSSWAAEQPPGAPVAASAPSAGTAWAALNGAQRNALAPLQRDWETIGPSHREKWLEVASRFPTMPAAERQRVQERMAEWARLSPAERTQTRLQFKEARQISPEDRQAKWQAYQALPEEQRRELAERAQPAVNGKAAAAGSLEVRAGSAADSKRNIVQPQRSTVAKPVTPTVLQAKPGATTTLISSPAALPPSHHQPGLPKIAATEGFVNPSTLLPKRGPQGAAAQPASAPSAAGRQ